jgi:hypothetical protein
VRIAWDEGINGVSRVVEAAAGGAIVDLGGECWWLKTPKRNSAYYVQKRVKSGRIGEVRLRYGPNPSEPIRIIPR